MKDPVDVVAVARIVGCFGVKGYVKLLPMTHTPERLNDLRDVEVGSPGGERVSDRVETVLWQNGQVLVKLQGIPDRTAAEQRVGQYLFVAGRDALPPEKGSYFVHDIIGCEVWSAQGTYLGVVDDVYPTAAQDLWAVKKGPKIQLIPAVKAFIEGVDIGRRRITVRLPEGLVEE